MTLPFLVLALTSPLFTLLHSVAIRGRSATRARLSTLARQAILVACMLGLSAWIAANYGDGPALAALVPWVALSMWLDRRSPDHQHDRASVVSALTSERRRWVYLFFGGYALFAVLVGVVFLR